MQKRGIMDNQDRIEEQLKGVNDKLALINQNMLKVFWIVAVFAFLYFGLMLYMLFIKA
jgi:hypothetical protein